ncbi:MAG: RNase adapter RapZ [Bacteroidales bacterium]|nr:RNase adapter RapZ [Bacteroidales bacterium]
MMDLKEIQLQLNELFTQITGTQSLYLAPLAESGSTRKYFRIAGIMTSFIGVFNPNIEENRAFFSYAESFKKVGLPVPEVLAISADESFYLQTDLGEVSLFELAGKAIDSGGLNDSVIAFYKEALNNLVLFQCDAHKQIDYSKSWPTAVFNKKSILDDLYYFKYYFVKLHPEISCNESLLDADFENFANFIASSPSDFFMYRDFQARNIMILEGKTWFIDFQGGRMGPLQYDVVSLLYQVKAQLPEKLREDLIEHYLRQLSNCLDVAEIQFRKFLPSFIYLRLMQVMGAYGFRGIIQRKQHFLESIPFSILELEQQLKLHQFANELPELSSVLLQLVQLKSLYPVKEKTKTKDLTIQLSSFSYKKKGIPYDQSGNGGGFVFDCRALPNPGREAGYKMQTGKDPAVIAFLEKHNVVSVFLDHVFSILRITIDDYTQRKFSNLMISFGCTGGQHRSVYCAEKTAVWMHKNFPEVNVILQHNEQKTA